MSTEGSMGCDKLGLNYPTLSLITLRYRCRAATVEALTQLVCLCLGRDRFVEILGPLNPLMQREKSPQVLFLQGPSSSPMSPHIQLTSRPAAWSHSSWKAVYAA